MSKKLRIIYFILLFVSVFTQPVFAEKYDSFIDWTDLFFRNNKEPWNYHKSELTFLNNELKNFECKNLRTKDFRYQTVCLSGNNKYEGNYKIIFDFGTGNDLILKAFEITAYHPAVKWDWDNYGTIDRVLLKMADDLKIKSFVGSDYNNISRIKTETNKEFSVNDLVHAIFDKGSTVNSAFWFKNTGITVGHNKELIIVNVSSLEYFRDKYYYEVYSEKNDKTTTYYILDYKRKNTN
ncbi:MAG: hypothetical protein IJI14_08200 [Anaerolineaceae bacterium]|nr:hypothetical protein [Anaerolineaceae bacterium]